MKYCNKTFSELVRYMSELKKKPAPERSGNGENRNLLRRRDDISDFESGFIMRAINVVQGFNHQF